MLFVGCSNNEESKSSSQNSTEKSTDERVSITFWVAENPNLDYDTCLETKFLEEMFNVDLQFEVYSSAADVQSQFNLLLTSGDYPDVFAGNYSTTQVTAAAEAGAIIALNDYIVDGTNYKAALDENTGWEARLTATDGNIYNFFYTDVGAHKQSEYKMWYNVSFLNNLGWDAPPATPEEFKQYLINIRDEDANGNGDMSDEIPLMGYYDGRRTDPICFLMNPFELYTDNYYYITDDNQIYFSAVTDGWRKGLGYIADLYSEGLIAEETYIQDQATYQGYLNKPEGEAVIGVTPSWYLGSLIDTSVMSWFDYLPLAPLSGKYQQTAARTDGELNLNCMISTACEHPDLVFEILDYLQGEEGGILSVFGVEGETFEYVEGKNYLDESPAIKFIVDDKSSYVWTAGLLPRTDSQFLQYGTLKDEALIETDKTYDLLNAAKVYEPYYVNHNTPNFLWCMDEELLQAVNDYSAQINEYIKTMNTQFIVGKLDVNDDNTWQNYLDELDKMGLQEYIELLYAYYSLK